MTNSTHNTHNPQPRHSQQPQTAAAARCPATRDVRHHTAVTRLQLCLSLGVIVRRVVSVDYNGRSKAQVAQSYVALHCGVQRRRLQRIVHVFDEVDLDGA